MPPRAGMARGHPRRRRPSRRGEQVGVLHDRRAGRGVPPAGSTLAGDRCLHPRRHRHLGPSPARSAAGHPGAGPAHRRARPVCGGPAPSSWTSCPTQDAQGWRSLLTERRAPAAWPRRRRRDRSPTPSPTTWRAPRTVRRSPCPSTAYPSRCATCSGAPSAADDGAAAQPRRRRPRETRESGAEGMGDVSPTREPAGFSRQIRVPRAS